MEQGFRQGYVLAPLVFRIFFAAVINMTYTRFKANKDIMDSLVHLRKKTGSGGTGGNKCRRASPSDVALGHALR